MSRFFDRMRPSLAQVLLGAFIASMGAQALAQSKAILASASNPWAQIGRAATADEIKAWDIDVRADFKGLPPGSGSVDKGQQIWEAKCASCHGVFGESTDVFTPIVGGTSKQDIKTGRVANLTRPDYPQRTTMMKVSQLSTLWDYINRAMPWTAPKSLKPDEVYAVIAFMLNLAEVVPEDFILSDKNIAQVQQRMPNRNGAAVYTQMWSVAGKPDVQGSDCMSNCATDMDVRSMLPDYARASHGNLAEQNRVVGPFRGAETLNPKANGPVALAKTATGKVESQSMQTVKAPAQKTADQVAKQANCLACHATDRKLVGPSFRQVADKYKGDPKAPGMLAAKIRKGGQGVWGQIPMPANDQLSDADLRLVVSWILEGGR